MSASAGLNPLPPSVTHSTSRLTHLGAHTLLSSFLEHAENDAAYRPDSTLTERGPQALSSGSTPNLTLAHLKRILLGMEGKRVGGGVKVAGEQDEVGEEALEQGSADNGEVEDGENEAESQQPQSRKGKKRGFEDTGDNQHTPKSKKPKHAPKIIASPNAERTSDPTGGAVLGMTTLPPSNQEQESSEDWQDPTLYALGQNEMNTYDAARAEGEVESGGNDAGEDGELDFEDLDAGNAIEQARNPSAGLKQPRSKREEKALVSIRTSATGESTADQEGEEESRTKKSKKDKKTRPPLSDDGPAVLPAPAGEQSKKKQKKTQKDADLDRDGDVDMEVDATAATSSPARTKNAADEEATHQALSKDERKKLKKLRHQETKKEREEARLKNKRA